MVALTVLRATMAFAQTGSTAEAGQGGDTFLKEAAYRSVLYRGRGVPEYRTIVFNGTPYWDKPDFITGKLTVDGREYDGVLMNIDAHRQEIHVKYADGMSAVILEPSRVSFCQMGGSRYVNLFSQGIPKAAPGYYKVLSDGPVKVFQRVNKILKTSTDNVNGDLIGYYDTSYRVGGVKYFYRDETYWWITKDGRLKKAGRSKALKLAGHAE